MRVFLFAIFALLATPVLLVGSWVAYTAWREHAFRRNTPLAANLDGDFSVVRAQFRERVRQKFPPGTSVDLVVADLRAKGFEVSALRDSGIAGSDPESKKISALLPSARMLVHDQTILLCDFDWVVGWDVDAARRIKVIYGDLRGICL